MLKRECIFRVLNRGSEGRGLHIGQRRKINSCISVPSHIGETKDGIGWEEQKQLVQYVKTSIAKKIYCRTDVDPFYSVLISIVGSIDSSASRLSESGTPRRPEKRQSTLFLDPRRPSVYPR